MARKAKTDAVNTEAATEVPSIVSYKAFSADLKCRDFQFEVGKTYTVEGQIKACQNGFHAVAADNPLHVWDFYPLIDDAGRMTRYAEVTQSGELSEEKTPEGTKVASASIAINVEISLPDFIRKAVSKIIELTKGGMEGVTTASGHSSQLAASGDYSKLAASGHSSQLAASGDYSKLAASGHSSQLAASGDYSKLAASGDYSKLAASGHSSQLAASGHSSQLAASGHSSQLAASGHSSVIASSSVQGSAKGGAGTWISLAEYDSNYKCVGFATGCIGQDGLEPNVYYVAKGGKLIPAT